MSFVSNGTIRAAQLNLDVVGQIFVDVPSTTQTERAKAELIVAVGLKELLCLGIIRVVDAIKINTAIIVNVGLVIVSIFWGRHSSAN